MIYLDVLVSDHKGAGRRALKTICDYADVTNQNILLTATSWLPSQGIEGSRRRDAVLIPFYESFGFVSSDESYVYEGVAYPDNVMERKPNVNSATVRVRQNDIQAVRPRDEVTSQQATPFRIAFL